MPALAPQLAPELGESQADFTDRVHQALDGETPTAERQKYAFEAWEAAHGDPLQQLGINEDPFSPNRFIRVRNQPVFAEHTTKDKDGNPVVYDRSALQAIADRCNQRIADTGDFSPLTAGHTPDKEQLAAGRDQPDVLGYVGPYRLGKIGNSKPRWAIFADEWHDKNERPRLEKLRRRSPEVWLEERMEDRILDPIAALGAETPRLDLGLTKLCRLKDGRDVAKYQMYPDATPYRCSMPGATFPGGMNTFVPGDDGKKRNAAGSEDPDGNKNVRVQQFGDEHHVQHLIDGDPAHWETTSIHPSVEDAQSHIERLNGAVQAYSRESNVDRYFHDSTYGNQVSTGPLSPQAIDQIVMALMQTEPLQYLLDMMQQGPQHAVDQDDEPPHQPEEDPVSEEPIAEAPEEGDEQFQESGEQPPEVPPEDEQPEPERMAQPQSKNPIPEQGEEQLADQPQAPKEGENKKAEDYLTDKEFDGEDEKKHYSSMDHEQKCAYAAFKRDYRKKKYEATGVPDKPLAESGTLVHGGETAKNSRAAANDAEQRARYARMERELNETKRQVERLAAAERSNAKKLRDADRYGRLQARRNEFAFEIEPEWERIKDWPDAQFDAHVDETIVANYQRMPIGVELWSPPIEAIERHAESQQTKKEIADEAVRRATSQPDKYTFASARAEVMKERGLKTA